jgi:hypothetical protein
MSKIAALRDLLFNLLQEHARDGTIPTNARFLFYELVQRGRLSKEKTGARRPDQDLHDALTDIREDGRIPWDWIVDETRALENYTGYAGVEAGVLSKLPYIALDPRGSRAPMILTESRSLAGAWGFTPVGGNPGRYGRYGGGFCHEPGRRSVRPYSNRPTTTPIICIPVPTAIQIRPYLAFMDCLIRF